MCYYAIPKRGLLMIVYSVHICQHLATVGKISYIVRTLTLACPKSSHSPALGEYGKNMGEWG